MRTNILSSALGFTIALATPTLAALAASRTETEQHVTLERVLDLALRNSFQIALANEQFDAAGRALKTAKRRRLPRLSAQGWFSGDLFEIDRWGSRNLASYLALDWDFYQDGAIMQLVAQSWANLASAALTLRQTSLELIYNSTALFYDALKAFRQVEIAQQQLVVEQMQLRIVRSEFDQGRRTQSELGEAETRAFELALSVTRAQQDLQRAILKLQQLTRDDTIQGVARFPREIVWTVDFPLEDAVQAGLEHQPNVLIAKANLDMARLGVKYARLKRWPSVRFLTGSDFAFAPFADPEEFGVRVGVIVSYPLYDAGDRKSRIEDAKSAARQAEIRVWQAHDQMKQEVTDSYTDVSNKLELLRIAERRHEKVRTDFAIAEKRYEAGRIDQLEMARIRLQYSQSVQRIEGLRLDALLARAKLLKSVGVSSLDEIRAYSRKETEEEK